MACLTPIVQAERSQSNYRMLFDFRNMSTLDGWVESSDTARTVGKSKASFVLQTTQVFQKGVLFAMLNPQPNGACFAGFVNDQHTFALSGYDGLELEVRQQGEAKVQKVVLYHHGDREQDGKCSYQATYTADSSEVQAVRLPWSLFEATRRGQRCPDAPRLDPNNITSVGLQVAGGVHDSYSQRGVSALEVSFIRAYLP